MIEFELHGLSE